jgi:hemin uptake protein HemP
MMVLQWALPAGQAQTFYKVVMQEQLDDKKETSGKVVSSKELFGNEKLIHIEHEGTRYRLMITRQGKLILNK